jgi:hypothetical protein
MLTVCTDELFGNGTLRCQPVVHPMCDADDSHIVFGITLHDPRPPAATHTQRPMIEWSQY